MSHIQFRCDGGHEINVDLPDEVFTKVFANEPLILPCPTCGKKYIVYDEDHHERFKHRMIQFPALHY